MMAFILTYQLGSVGVWNASMMLAGLIGGRVRKIGRMSFWRHFSPILARSEMTLSAEMALERRLLEPVIIRRFFGMMGSTSVSNLARVVEDVSPLRPRLMQGMPM